MTEGCVASDCDSDFRGYPGVHDSPHWKLELLLLNGESELGEPLAGRPNARCFAGGWVDRSRDSKVHPGFSNLCPQSDTGTFEISAMVLSYSYIIHKLNIFFEGPNI